MRYYLDCEFNGYRGRLLSMALVRDDGEELYLVASSYPHIACEAWVAENVVPIMFPEWLNCNGKALTISTRMFGAAIEEFIRGDPLPTIIADWPDDIRYFCECLITGPGEMLNIPQPERIPSDPLLTRRGPIMFDVHRVDAYPTELPGAVQHNALWDARALRHKLAGPA